MNTGEEDGINHPQETSQFRGEALGDPGGDLGGTGTYKYTGAGAEFLNLKKLENQQNPEKLGKTGEYWRTEKIEEKRNLKNTGIRRKLESVEN